MTTREGRRVQADRRASAGGLATARDHAGDGPAGQMAGLARRFPPRALEEDLCVPKTPVHVMRPGDIR